MYTNKFEAVINIQDSYKDLKPHFVYDFLRRYSFINFLIIFIATYCYLTSSSGEESWNISCYYKIIWLTTLPYTVSSFIGLIYFKTSKNSNMHKYVKNKTLYLVLVTKGTNPESVLRTIDKMSYVKEPLNINGIEVKFYLLLDEPCDSIYIENGLNILMVPSNFQTKYAKYKARALEYFRQQMKLSGDDWVLHLDEESILMMPDLYQCIDFILSGKFKFGRGVILYNSHEYFKNELLTVLDSIRVGDDLGRFTVQHCLLNKAIFGLHGSFLLVNGEVENRITWDNKYSYSLVEDFAFAMKCNELGYKCGQISGIVREISPKSLQDLIIQRRRWFSGIWQLPHLYARILAVLWTLSPLNILITLIHIPLCMIFPMKSPLWLDILSSFSFIVCIYIYLIGIYVQDLDLKLPLRTRIYHLLIGFILIPTCSVIESYAVLYSLIYPAISFDVIKK
jgi:hypothetical protein